ncbi:MAG: FHA domain-containing protein [Planctomycetota bacterium]
MTGESHAMATMTETSTHTVGRLKALTPEAEYAIEGQLLTLDIYPFRVGRESRRREVTRALLGAGERRQNSANRNNDLYIAEQTREVFVSREHFEIQRDGDSYFLVDRNSALGTWVEGNLVGGSRKGGRVPLHSGDVIIVASHQSGLVFKFLVEEEA